MLWNTAMPLPEIELIYPIYIIPHGGGYLSIVDPEDNTTQLLVVCGTQELVMRLIHQFQILSAPRALNNDREFAWLLRSLKSPVTKVVFDPKPEGESINGRTTVAVNDLLTQHLKPDLSPWNYPVFAIAKDDGFVSIDSDDGAGGTMTLLTLFTEKDLATDFLKETDQSGTLCRLGDVGQARTFLKSIDKSLAVAVALDPTVEGDQQTAKYCFAIEVLLEKYLVAES